MIWQEKASHVCVHIVVKIPPSSVGVSFLTNFKAMQDSTHFMTGDTFKNALNDVGYKLLFSTVLLGNQIWLGVSRNWWLCHFWHRKDNAESSEHVYSEYFRITWGWFRNCCFGNIAPGTNPWPSILSGVSLEEKHIGHLLKHQHL